MFTRMRSVREEGIHFGVLSNLVSAIVLLQLFVKNLTSKMLKQLNLSQSSLGENLLAEDIGNL
jgi:hypothetical protein